MGAHWLAFHPCARQGRSGVRRGSIGGLDDVLETVLQDGDIFVTLGAGSIGAWAAEFPRARHLLYRGGLNERWPALTSRHCAVS